MKIIFGVLFFLFLLEASMIPIFVISVPGSPLTLGRLALVGLGVLGWIHRPVRKQVTNHDWFVLLLVIGTLIGTFFSKNFGSDFVTFIGFSLLVFSSKFTSQLMGEKLFKKMLLFFYFATFIYWVYYVWSKVFQGGGFVTYGEIYRAERSAGSGLVNYHAFGLLLSSSIVFFYAFRDWAKKINLWGIGFIVLGLATIFVTESRANLIITILILVWIYLRQNKAGIGSIIRLSVLVLALGTVFSYFTGSNERLERRFDVNDTEYIEGSTSSRIAFIGLVLNETIKHPFGEGPNKNRVNYYGTFYQPHNQYLTFVLFAGIFGLIAIVVWMSVIWEITFAKSFSNANFEYSVLSIIHIGALVMITTDLSGAYFFLLIILQGWLIQLKNNPN